MKSFGAPNPSATKPTARPPLPVPSAPPVAGPAQMLPPRRHTHWQTGALLLGVGVAGFAFAPALHLPDSLGSTLLLFGIIGGILVMAVGEKKYRRDLLQDRVIEALCPLLMGRAGALDDRICKFKQWTRGRPGHPLRIVLHHAPGLALTSFQAQEPILGLLKERLGVSYKVVKADARRCKLWLEAVANPGEDPEAAKSQQQRRAEKALHDLIGATTEILHVDVDDEGEVTRISARHDVGVKIAAPGYRRRIESVINAMFPGRWRAHWDLENDQVTFEQRPLLPKSIWVPTTVPDNIEDLLRNYRQVKISYGVDEDGVELCWYPGRVPHMMITGGTGTGKTATAHALLAKIAQYGWPVWAADPKRVEFMELRSWPNVQVVASNVPHQVALIHRAWRAMEQRYTLIEQGKKRPEDFEPLFIFLDEFAELRANLMEWYATMRAKDKSLPNKPVTLAEVASLARKARTARIHLILMTQRPDAEFLGGEMRDNFGTRASMGRLSPQGAQMMWENPSVGVSLPRDCVGRAMSTHPNGSIAEIQCYRFPSLDPDRSDEETQILDLLRPEPRHPRLVIGYPQARDEKEAGYWEYANAPWYLAEDRPDLDLVKIAEEARASDTDNQRGSILGMLGLAGPDDACDEDLQLSYHDVDDTLDTAAGSALSGDGYGDVEEAGPDQLLPGDMVQLEPGEPWVVVESTIESIFDELAVAVSWRTDDDESGVTEIPRESTVQVRRPMEFNDGEGN